MIKQTTLLCAVALALVMTCASNASAQTDTLRFTISLDQPVFTPRSKVKMRVKVENETGRTIQLDDVDVSIRLLKHPNDFGSCRATECFSADVNSRKEIKSADSSEFEVTLTDLHWADLILSGKSLSRPKNLYKIIPVGDYHLFLEFGFPEISVRGIHQPRIVLNSNYIPVKMEARQ